MYFGLSQQSKHSRDIAAVLESEKNELDLDYIESWIARLGLSSLECQISKSGMIAILGIQFSTQQRIVLSSS